MNINEFFLFIKKSLLNDQADFEAKQIVLHLLNIGNTDFLIRKNEDIKSEHLEKAKDLIKKRNSGIPLYYLLGICEFYSLPFKVGEGVLIPRADTEILVENALDSIKNISNPKVLDLCAGSGAISIAIAKNRPDSVVEAVELSDTALKFLRANKELNNCENLKILKENALTFTGDYDIVVSNPPYIAYCEREQLEKEVLCEPEMALFTSENGLHFYNQITKNFSSKSDFKLIFEVGETQSEKVSQILETNNFSNIQIFKDYNNKNRVVLGEK